jgi:glycosyltransferase involved in cell wall biosynthesis
MKVSVITVSYNNRDTIEKTIESVARQRYENLEYIIVDGNSTDGTESLLKKYDEKVSRWVSEPDEGIYHAMNKGLEMAEGELIGFLHADDFYASPDVIPDVVEMIQTMEADACYADLQYVNRTYTEKIVRTWKSGRYKSGEFLNGWMPPHPTLFVKKEIYEKYGGFKTDLGSAADYELMLRFIHKHEIKLAYLPEKIIKMRTGGESNVSLANRLKANLNDRKAWKVNGLKPKPWTLWMKPLRKIRQFFVW